MGTPRGLQKEADLAAPTYLLTFLTLRIVIAWERVLAIVSRLHAPPGAGLRKLALAA
jgi:hypothetical protein